MSLLWTTAAGRTTHGLVRGTASGYGYDEEIAWVAPDGSRAFIADGRPFGAAVLHEHPKGRITLSTHPDKRYEEKWEAESIAAARAHEGV